MQMSSLEGMLSRKTCWHVYLSLVNFKVLAGMVDWLTKKCYRASRCIPQTGNLFEGQVKCSSLKNNIKLHSQSERVNSIDF